MGKNTEANAESSAMSLKFKVTLLGSRAVGKTSLAHFAVNSGPRTGGYDATTADNPAANKFLYQLDHPELGKCLLDIEDTPGYKPDPRNEREEKVPPVELLEPHISYLFCDDGARKPGAAEPEPEDLEGEEGEGNTKQTATAKTELLAPGANDAAGVSALDALAQLDRQGFIVVYNSMDRDSFKEAEKILLELADKMTKSVDESGDKNGEEEEIDEDEPPPEIPPMPIVLVATHSDAKKKDKKVKKKDLVAKEEGTDLADGMAIPFFETNAIGGGKHVQDVFIAVASNIQKVEDNLIWDKGPTCCERCCASRFCKECCPSCCARCGPSCCKRLRSCCSFKKCCGSCCEGPYACCGLVCCTDGCNVKCASDGCPIQ